MVAQDPFLIGGNVELPPADERILSRTQDVCMPDIAQVFLRVCQVPLLEWLANTLKDDALMSLGDRLTAFTDVTVVIHEQSKQCNFWVIGVSPNIVAVKVHADDEEQWYIVQEFYEGWKVSTKVLVLPEEAPEHWGGEGERVMYRRALVYEFYAYVHRGNHF